MVANAKIIPVGWVPCMGIRGLVLLWTGNGGFVSVKLGSMVGQWHSSVADLQSVRLCTGR